MQVKQQLSFDSDIYDDGFDDELLDNDETIEYGSLYPEYPLDNDDDEQEINYWNTSGHRYSNRWTRVL